MMSLKNNEPGLLDTPKLLFNVIRNAKSSRARLVKYQNSEFKKILSHALRNVPFYKNLYHNSGVSISKIKSINDLIQLPAVSKEEVRNEDPISLIDQTKDPSKLQSISTTGSTGRPFRIYNSWLEIRRLHLFRLRAHRQFGRRVGDRIVEIDQPFNPHVNDKKYIGNILRKIGIEGRIQHSLYESTDFLLDQLEAYKPHIVTAYPNVLHRLGTALSKNPRKAINPRFLLTNSEVLTPGMRNQIRENWGDPDVFQFYDCHECNLIAWDCPEGYGLHCVDDLAIVEVLRDGIPVNVGERGEVAITSLHSYAMPFIRFKLGDIATRGPAPCPCGQPFSTLMNIEGRMVDFFRLPGGKWLHPYRIIENLDRDGGDWIQQYRLVQEREDRIVFKAIPTASASQDRLDEFRRYAKEAVGPGVEIEVNFVDQLDIGPGGKLRPAKSLIHTDYESIDWNNTL